MERFIMHLPSNGDELLALLFAFWPIAVATFNFAVTFVVSAHAILNKRDVRAAVAWVGLISLVPIVGALLYLIFGVNRIQRRASRLRAERPSLGPQSSAHEVVPANLAASLPGERHHLLALERLIDRVSDAPLVGGNAITHLVGGAKAYPAMLEQIAAAKRSIALESYIFDHDAAGIAFVDALEAAVHRGVEVRVLIDAVGARYSRPSIVRRLRRRRIKVATFLPTSLPWRIRYANLRSHRKLLIVDGTAGFTGGMNIREGHYAERGGRHAIQDLHFRLGGPVVAQMMDVFANDWAFMTRETLSGENWFPSQASKGQGVARAIAAGPDEGFEILHWVLTGAISQARESLRIVTPYFLPDQTLITALCVAAMRGVKVEILLPEVNNLRLVQWASTAQLWQVLDGDCEVALTPPPFDHSKLLLVDGAWALIGSANWDARSMRLNFEMNVECYDPDLVSALDRLFDQKRSKARPVTIDDVDSRGLAVQLRDGIARLAAPYL